MNNIELYQKIPTKELGQKLLDEHKDVINAHRLKWSGVLPDVVIKKHAETYALDAFKSYDPSRGASITTHLFNHLSKLSRLNYENQNVVKIPEHQILQISHYKDVVAHLTDKLDRQPSIEEISDHMFIPVSHVKRLEQNLSHKDFTYDSDKEDIQQRNIEASPESLYIQDTFGKLKPIEQKQFKDLTGYGESVILKPSAFGQKYKLKPYEVSRVKASLAKRFGK